MESRPEATWLERIKSSRAGRWLRTPTPRTRAAVLVALAGLAFTAWRTIDAVFNEEPPRQTEAAAELARNYYTLDGLPPALTPDCWGVLSLCLGDEHRTLVEAFSQSDSEYENDDVVSHQWYIEDALLLTASMTAEDRIGSMSISQLGVPVTVPSSRASLPVLPEGESEHVLVLGSSTFEEAFEHFRPYEPEVSVDRSEGWVIVSAKWGVGPEGLFPVSATRYLSVLEDPGVEDLLDMPLQDLGSSIADMKFDSFGFGSPSS